MKYVVSGYIGFDNFGDEAIARSLVQKLQKEGAEKITLISSNPEKTKNLHGVNSCGMLTFMPELISSDVLISGGGSLLQDVTSIKSLIYYLIVIFSALILGKQVEIFAQGIGPINSKFGQFLTKIALKKAVKITVRDINSQNLLKEWGIISELVKDPVLELDLPQKQVKGTVGIQLRSFAGMNEEFLHNLAKEVKSRFSDKKIVLLSLQDSIDLDLCNNFAQILKNNGTENVTIFNQLNIDEVIEKISNLEYLIGMRYHANVIGVKSGVKTLAINYDPKVEALAQEFDLPYIKLQDTDFTQSFDKLCVTTM